MKSRLAVGGFNFIHAVGLDFICAADFILAKARITDLIVMDGFCTVINGNDLNREGLRVLLAYFMDVGDRLDETMVWLGKVELPNLPSFVQYENFLQLLLNCEQIVKQAQSRYDTMQQHTEIYSYLPRHAIAECLEADVYAALQCASEGNRMRFQKKQFGGNG